MDHRSLVELGERLGRWAGRQARVWLYLQSLRQLHIQLGEDGHAFADLICYRCWRIEVPSEWQACNIRVQETSEGKLSVSDDAGRVHVVCELVRVVEGVKEPVV